MSKGVIIIAYGKHYGRFAYNLAASIKAKSSVKIHLVCDELAIKDIPMIFFDSHKIYDFPRDGNKIDPCQVKIDISKMSPFDKTLYLDADSICFNSIDPLFDSLSGSDVYVQVMGIGGENDKINYSHWANNDVIWPHFKIPKDAIYCASQTSIIYFEKGEKSKKFFSQLQKNYKNRLDKKQYTNMWGLSQSHPDELYYSVTLAQEGIVPDKEIQPIFYPNVLENEGVILKDYTLMSIYGAQRTIKHYSLKLYDRVMNNVFRDYGKPNLYKAESLYKHKFTGIR